MKGYERMKLTKKKLVLGILMVAVFAILGYQFIPHTIATPDSAIELDLSLNENPYYLEEATYAAIMATTVLPYIEQYHTSGSFDSFDGTTIHYDQYVHPDAKASIVISHGFTEFGEAYEEVIYYFLRNHYSVFTLDHRSHGYSERFSEDLSLVTVANFTDFIEDFNCYINEIVRPASKGIPLLLYAHSMGGAIGALYLETYPDIFEAAILSSPMMEIDLGSYPLALTKLICNAFELFGISERYLFGHEEFKGISEFEISGSTSEARYNYVFNHRLKDENFQTSGGSFAWLTTSLKATEQLIENASLIQVPTLLFQAGQDSLVKPSGQNQFVENASTVQMILVPDSKHEIYRSTNDVLIPYMNTILDFYEEHISGFDARIE